MVNLLKFKTPGGLESYQRYGREVAPHLERVGATVRYAGAAPAFVIGDGEKPWWDAILIVEYPTPRAFIDMVTAPEYAQGARTSRGRSGARRPDRDVGMVPRGGVTRRWPGPMDSRRRDLWPLGSPRVRAVSVVWTAQF